ncbi:MAG TPA: 50S ribosomal protein L29 [Euryarchaeota archaeon]|nr:MAG: 50S ribosomal protein L29 [Thermoplasmata archaeon]HHD16123.1 50S ribosomal protein L29 [Euryarchaeota archaeon]
MALLRLPDIRAMKPEERSARMRELRDELLRERGVSAMGGAPPSPGKIKALRTSIARLATVMREEGEL